MTIQRNDMFLWEKRKFGIETFEVIFLRYILRKWPQSKVSWTLERNSSSCCWTMNWLKRKSLEPFLWGHQYTHAFYLFKVGHQLEQSWWMNLNLIKVDPSNGHLKISIWVSVTKCKIEVVNSSIHSSFFC